MRENPTDLIKMLFLGLSPPFSSPLAAPLLITRKSFKMVPPKYYLLPQTYKGYWLGLKEGLKEELKEGLKEGLKES